MTRLPLVILPALVGLALAGTAFTALAAQVNLMATLTGTEEVPPNTSGGTGTVEATYDTDSNVLNYTVTYSGLSGDATAAHFHGPAAPGENAPPTVPVEGSLASPIAGTATLTDEQEAQLLGGQWYFNLHTAQYPDGELRGQVLQSAASDEASSEVSSSSMDSSMSSSSLDPSLSVSASVSVDPGTSSLSSAVSSVASSASSTVSSAASSATSSGLDVSFSASGGLSVSAP